MPGGIEAVCRKCKTSLKGCTYLQIGVNLGGSNKMCVDCIDKYMVRGGYKSVRDWVTAYIKEFKPDTVQSLKVRVQELERLLEGLTNPSREGEQ